MHILTRLTACTAMLAAMSACSTGVTDTPTPTPSSTHVYSKDAGNAVQALNAGSTLQANDTASASYTLDYGNGTTAKTASPATVSLTKNAGGGVTLTVNGVKQVFTSSDLDPNGYGYGIKDAANNKYVGVYTWDQNSSSTALGKGNTNYVTAWGYNTNQILPNGVSLEGFALLGTETKPADLASLPTATYSGSMTALTYPDTGFVDNATSQGRLKGNVAMTANFGAGTVNGNLSSLQLRDPGSTTWNSTSGAIAMNSAPISGNGFSGTLTPDATYVATAANPTIASGSYSGSFYGPAADQVGGILSLQGSRSGTPYTGMGFFTAGQSAAP